MFGEDPAGRRRLYHAAPSYYSMIARLALTEGRLVYLPVKLDIHRRREQFAPDYVRLNPHMTVPTLVEPGRVLTDSRDILTVAFPKPGSDEARWIETQYGFPVEELTMGRMLATNSLARIAMPRMLRSIHTHLLQLAAAHSDLRQAYETRAAVFETRIRTFDPPAAARLFARRWAEAETMLDALERQLAGGESFLAGADYGPADVVWTVFLARIRFIGKGAAIEARPALRTYERSMSARPSYSAADIWPRFSPLKMLRQLFL